ncbi:MAG: hypothetical protein AB7D03_03400 [Thiomicrospira sp.]
MRHFNLIRLGKDGNILDEQRLFEDLNEHLRALSQDKYGLFIYQPTAAKSCA